MWIIFHNSCLIAVTGFCVDGSCVCFLYIQYMCCKANQSLCVWCVCVCAFYNVYLHICGIYECVRMMHEMRAMSDIVDVKCYDRVSVVVMKVFEVKYGWPWSKVLLLEGKGNVAYCLFGTLRNAF